MECPAFHDRHDAGRQLAVKVAALADAWQPPHSLLVLGLPRGGVPVAYEVAKLLGAPLDVLPVRKLGLPGAEEYAVGAIASLNGDVVQVLDEAALRGRPDVHGVLDRVVRTQRAELVRRRQVYRGTRPPLQLHGRDVVLVDDGLATGATMRAAVGVARQGHARRILVAVPVAAADALTRLCIEANACISVAEVPNLQAVGMWYDDFSPTSDAEVIALLAEAERRQAHLLAPG